MDQIDRLATRTIEIPDRKVQGMQNAGHGSQMSKGRIRAQSRQQGHGRPVGQARQKNVLAVDIPFRSNPFGHLA